MANTAKMPDMGPLEVFFKDDLVTEIMVNDTRNVFVEREGRCVNAGVRLQDVDELQRLVRNLTDAAHRYVTLENPYADFSLPDGSRVNIVAPPLTVGGPAITIRRFPKRRLLAEDLMKNLTMDQRLAYFLNVCVVGRINILICGGTGSGKTTLLNLLAQFVPKNERIVTIEDVSEIQVLHENAVRMLTKTGMNGNQSVGARELVANALRMRPDRLILGECRRGEALDLLQVMNTGHEGSMSTLHANSPREALFRLETLALMGGVDLPLVAIRKQIASSLNLLVQIKRFRSGARKIVQVAEITGMEGDVVTLQDLFLLEEGDAEGVAKATGYIPTFLPQLHDRGISIEADYFQESAA